MIRFDANCWTAKEDGSHGKIKSMSGCLDGINKGPLCNEMAGQLGMVVLDDQGSFVVVPCILTLVDSDNGYLEWSSHGQWFGSLCYYSGKKAYLFMNEPLKSTEYHAPETSTGRVAVPPFIEVMKSEYKRAMKERDQFNCQSTSARYWQGVMDAYVKIYERITGRDIYSDTL